MKNVRLYVKLYILSTISMMNQKFPSLLTLKMILGYNSHLVILIHMKNASNLFSKWKKNFQLIMIHTFMTRFYAILLKRENCMWFTSPKRWTVKNKGRSQSMNYFQKDKDLLKSIGRKLSFQLEFTLAKHQLLTL